MDPGDAAPARKQDGIDMWITFCYNRGRNRNKGVIMVLPEDKYDPIVDALNRINESLEEQNDTLRKISHHYDSVVPVMKRNADRVENAKLNIKDKENFWDDYLKPSFQKS